MRNLACDARNIKHAIIEREGVAEIETLIEAVITVMNRKMQFSGSGLVQTEDLETLRFDMTISGAKQLVAHMQKWIEDAESESGKLQIATD